MAAHHGLVGFDTIGRRLGRNPDEITNYSTRNNFPYTIVDDCLVGMNTLRVFVVNYLVEKKYNRTPIHQLNTKLGRCLSDEGLTALLDCDLFDIMGTDICLSKAEIRRDQAEKRLEKRVEKDLRQERLELLKAQAQTKLPAKKKTKKEKSTSRKYERLNKEITRYSDKINRLSIEAEIKEKNRSATLQTTRKRNRQVFVDLVSGTLKSVNGPGWEGYFKDHRQIKNDLDYLVDWKEHYREGKLVSMKNLDEADNLISLLEALLSFNQDEFIEATEPFKWPSTKVQKISRIFASTLDIRDSGTLARFGYRVGNNGSLEYERHRILDEIFVAEIRNRNFTNTNFGAPSSSTRLKRIVKAISFLTKNAKRQSSRDFSSAIADWESDLRYLRHKYYDDNAYRYNFDWPAV